MFDGRSGIPKAGRLVHLDVQRKNERHEPYVCSKQRMRVVIKKVEVLQRRNAVERCRRALRCQPISGGKPSLQLCAVWNCDPEESSVAEPLDQLGKDGSRIYEVFENLSGVDEVEVFSRQVLKLDQLMTLASRPFRNRFVQLAGRRGTSKGGRHFQPQSGSSPKVEHPRWCVRSRVTHDSLDVMLITQANRQIAMRRNISWCCLGQTAI